MGGMAIDARVAVASIVMALLSACGHDTGSPVPTSATTSPASTTTAVAEPPRVVATPHTKAWVELQVGDCLADPPPSDPGVVTVGLVDCAQPHVAEVFSRVPLALNTALADVADRACAEGFAQYTGRPVDGSAFSLTYLIDSNQDRTSDNPNPSAVICLLQDANGQMTTGSAHR
jgi:hypothetical protein